METVTNNIEIEIAGTSNTSMEQTLNTLHVPMLYDNAVSVL